MVNEYKPACIWLKNIDVNSVDDIRKYLTCILKNKKTITKNEIQPLVKKLINKRLVKIRL